MTTPAPRRWVGGLLAMFLLLVAAGLAVWGTFEKIQTYTHDQKETAERAASHFAASLTWWDYQQTGNGLARKTAFPPFGIVPALAAGLLVIGAVLVLTAVASGRGLGPLTAGRFAATLGVGVLAGAAAHRLMETLDNLGELNAQDVDPGESFDFQVGLGMYLVGGAVLIGLLGLVLTLTRPRQTPVRLEPATPPMGVPMPYPAPTPDR